MTAESRPWRRLVLVTPDAGGEYEATRDLGAVEDEAAADAALATFPGPWYEAMLCPSRADEARDAWRPDRRRYPGSSWVDVRRIADEDGAPSFQTVYGFDEVGALAEWVRAMGVSVEWKDLLRAPCPARETWQQDIPIGPWLRGEHRNGECDPLEALVFVIHLAGRSAGRARLAAEQGTRR